VNRIVSAARLHLVAPWLLLLPWAIMGSSFFINVLVWRLADMAEGREPGTAGLASLYLTLCIVYVQSMSALLPFAMGLSLTRRSFYLGTALFAGLQSLVYGVLFHGLLLAERATDGWGVGLPFFGGFWVVDNPILQVLVYVVPLLVLAFLGMAVGVMYKRFGSLGLYALIIGTILGFGGLGVLLAWQEGWRETVFGFFTGQSAVALFTGWPLLLGVLFAAAAYLGIRRVVP